MDKTSLKLLFDYQRFEQNSALQRMIDDSLGRYDSDPVPIDDDALEMVAAGLSDMRERKDDGQRKV